MAFVSSSPIHPSIPLSFQSFSRPHGCGAAGISYPNSLGVKGRFTPCTSAQFFCRIFSSYQLDDSWRKVWTPLLYFSNLYYCIYLPLSLLQIAFHLLIKGTMSNFRHKSIFTFPMRLCTHGRKMKTNERASRQQAEL